MLSCTPRAMRLLRCEHSRLPDATPIPTALRPHMLVTNGLGSSKTCMSSRSFLHLLTTNVSCTQRSRTKQPKKVCLRCTQLEWIANVFPEKRLRQLSMPLLLRRPGTHRRASIISVDISSWLCKCMEESDHH